MVYSAGIQAATQRIEEIRQKLGALEPKPQTTESTGAGQTFGQVLDSTMNPDKSTSPSDVSGIEDMVESQAQNVGLDPNLAKAVVKAESGFNPNAVSPVGAKGLMQLMPSTAQSLGVQAILDPKENVKGGTQYLSSLLEKYHNVPNALAAYNAGPGAVDKYGGVPPYKETQDYVQKVLGFQHDYEQQNAE